MFKVVLVFSLIVASAADQDKSHSKLSRHTEVSKPSNRTNQTITESFGNPIIDSLKMQKRTRNQQTRQAGKDPFIWFSKWSLTNHSCPPSVERPLKQTKAPYKNEDLVMSASVDRSPNKFEKLVELETTHSKGKRKAMIPGSDSELSLLDDWTEDKVKASHISHIYIGESLYPYIYEESRVFQSEPPKPSSGENNSHLKEVELSETRKGRKKEEEVPVYEITKIYEIK